MNNKPVSDATFARAFGKVCSRHRRELGYSQQAFALETDMDPSNYQCIEHGQTARGEMTNPQMRTILAIARGLGMTPSELINEAWELALTMNN